MMRSEKKLRSQENAVEESWEKAAERQRGE